MTRISGFKAVPESAILLTIRNRLPSSDKSKARQFQVRVSTYSGLSNKTSGAGGLHGAVHLQGHGHDGALVDVEELSPITTPDGCHAAVRRDLPTASTQVGEAPHVDFEPARLIRLVGNPPSIGRDLRIPLRCRRPEKDLGAILGEMMQQQIPPGFKRALLDETKLSPSAKRSKVSGCIGYQSSERALPYHSVAVEYTFANAPLPRTTRSPSGVQTGCRSAP